MHQSTIPSVHDLPSEVVLFLADAAAQSWQQRLLSGLRKPLSGGFETQTPLPAPLQVLSGACSAVQAAELSPLPHKHALETREAKQSMLQDPLHAVVEDTTPSVPVRRRQRRRWDSGFLYPGTRAVQASLSLFWRDAAGTSQVDMQPFAWHVQAQRGLLKLLLDCGISNILAALSCLNGAPLNFHELEVKAG